MSYDKIVDLTFVLSIDMNPLDEHSKLQFHPKLLSFVSYKEFEF